MTRKPSLSPKWLSTLSLRTLKSTDYTMQQIAPIYRSLGSQPNLGESTDRSDGLLVVVFHFAQRIVYTGTSAIAQGTHLTQPSTAIVRSNPR